MHSALNLNTTWTTGNFLNIIEHSCSGTVVNWYHSLNDEEKKLRIVEVLEAMFKMLC